ncbi:MAG: hypothetical protein N3A02_07905 [Rectinema sp.]|nr:hypothetical protein [Rectinema sp.]
MSTASAYFLALFGNFLLSLGFSLQKKNVAWLSARRRGERRQTREVVGWSFGFLLMNLQPIFNYLALKGLAPNIVAAVSGSNIVFTIILSRILLSEHVPRRKMLWILILAASLAMAGLVGQESSTVFRVDPFWFAFFIPTAFAMLVLLVMRRIGARKIGLFLGSAAGALGGFMVLVLEGLRLTHGSDFLSWIASPYLYVYIFCGVSSFLIKQVAFEKGDMNAVAPSFYGLLVLYPSIAAYFISEVSLQPLQVLAFGGIALSIIFFAK